MRRNSESPSSDRRSLAFSRLASGVSKPARHRPIAHGLGGAPVEVLEPRRLLHAVAADAAGELLTKWGDHAATELSQAAKFAQFARELNDISAGNATGSTSARGSVEGGVNVGPVVNISRRSGNESEADIAINPTNPNQIFVASNIASGSGLFMASSSDAGQTWTTRVGATGTDIPTACCDARVEYDNFGNLFMAYLGPGGSNHYVARSVNNGASFTIVDTKTGSWDNGAITVSHVQANGTQIVGVEARGPGGVNGYVGVSTGLGAPITFSAAQTVPGTSTTGNFGDIAILNDGSALITYTTPSGGQGPATDPVWRDPDGIGVGTGWVNVLNQATNVGGFDFFPAQSGRSVDSEPAFAVAPPGTPFAGRVYFTYTDEKVNENNDLDVMLRYSDDGGVTWSPPKIVNDDSTQNSQFLQQIAVDRVTGALVLSWHDARNDNGVLPNGTNTVPNDDAQFYGAVSLDGGETFQNFLIQPGWSNDNRAANGIDYGDWTGSDIYDGAFYAVWADNSQGVNGLPNNPTPNQFDLATARVEIQVATAPGVYGLVFDDSNGNAARDGGEPGLTGITVFIDNDNSGTITPGDLTTTTGGGGVYSFEGLSPGTYVVRTIAPAGRRLTLPGAGFYSAVVGTEPVVNQNFGYVNPRVAGMVYDDVNDNGVKDATEVGKSGVTVYLDLDDSGTLNGSEPSVVTGTDGAYALGGLDDGAYTARLVVPSGNRLTAPSAGSHTAAIGGGNLVALNRDFGLTTRVRLAGVVYDDANGNGTRDSGEAPLSGARVFLDVNDNGTFDNLGGSFASTNVPLNIPPGAPSSTSGITNSNLVVSGALGAVQNLTVTLNITHTFTGDLVITLISPAGTRVILVNRRGSGGDNFTNTTFDDAAATSITAGSAPFSGSFRPEQPLSALNGQSANGTWVLEINDAANGDVGTLNSWSISYGGVEPNVVTVADGAYAFPGLPPGPYTLRQVPIAGAVLTEPAGGAYALNTAPADLRVNNFGNSSSFTSSTGFYVRLNGVGDTIQVFRNTDGTGSPDFNVPASVPSLNLVGAGGDDLLVVDLINGNPIPTGGVNFDGQGGSDTAVLRGTAAAEAAVVSAGTLTFDGDPIATTNVESLRFEAGGGDDSLTFQGSPLDVEFLGQGGRNLLSVTGGAWTYSVNAATQNDLIDVDGFAGAAIHFNASQHLASLRLRAGVVGTLASGSGRMIRTGGVVIAPSGRLDLNDGGLIVDYDTTSPLATVQSYLSSGYAAGAWNGNGISSTFANASPAGDGLGYAEASDVLAAFPGTFLGEPVDATTVLARRTLNGDANLDGVVNIADFSRLAGNFNLVGGWSQGDFNYDGTVGIADFSALAANFNLSAAAEPAARPTGGLFGTRVVTEADRRPSLADGIFSGDPV